MTSPQTAIPKKNDVPFYILISTILSQRTRDEVTYARAKALFSGLKIRTAKDLAKRDIQEIEFVIRPVGFYKTKARRIKEVARLILEKYDNRVPDSVEELLKLPGVGRKTANCVLVYGFKRPAIPVDTHVHRVSNRLGLVKTNNPKETEIKLIQLIPKNKWILLNEAMVRHGKLLCRPVGPRCEECFLGDYCDYKLQRQNQPKK